MSRPAGGHPMSVVRRARDLVAAGWNYAETARLLHDQLGVTVAARTIGAWCDPDRAETYRRRSLEHHRARSGQGARFVLSGRTPEYRAAFIRELAAAGVLRTQIALVCQVVLEIPCSRSDVEAVLDGRIPRSLQATSS